MQGINKPWLTIVCCLIFHLQVIPAEIFMLHNLEVLKLRNNPISEIPDEIRHLRLVIASPHRDDSGNMTLEILLVQLRWVICQMLWTILKTCLYLNKLST